MGLFKEHLYMTFLFSWLIGNGLISRVLHYSFSSGKPYTLVLPKKVQHSQKYVPGKHGQIGTFEKTPYANQTLKEALDAARVTTGYMVTVDYHC